MNGPLQENVTTPTKKRKYIAYLFAVKERLDHGNRQHAKKIW